jgi:cell division protein FtsQ
MSETKRDLHNQRPLADVGKARQRKAKREHETGISSRAGSEDKAGKLQRPMVGRRSRPSDRESLVTDQIRNMSEALPSLKGKLSSGLGLGSRPAKPEAARRRSRRDNESRRKESPFEASPHAETQRVTGNDYGYMPAKNRRIYDARSEARPPVMVRGGMGGMAFGRVATSRLAKSRTPKRRIDVPLRVTGAEVRLPAIPFFQLGWRAVSLLIVLMMSASLVLMWKAPVFQVGAVEGIGLKRLTVNDLNAVMGTFGKSVFSVNPTAVRQSLSQAFPELSKISVRVNLPAKVKVVVTERQPIISWSQDGVETWVDAEGISFPPRGVPEKALVQVEGYGSPPSEAAADDQTGLTATTTFVPTAKEPVLKLSPELISAILTLGVKMPEGTVLVYDSQRGLGWNDPNGWEVFFGDESQDMDMKVAVYQALVERLQSEGIQPALISVEFVHAPYYRMER